MIRFLIVILVLVALYFALRWFANAKLEDAKRATQNAIIFLVLGILIALAVTGRLHWLFAAVGVALPFLGKAWRAWRALRWLRKSQPQQTPPQSTKSGTVTTAEAYAILGLKPGANREQIIAAHRKLIRNAHPDRGGSDQQAQQLNAAKEHLLDLDKAP